MDDEQRPFYKADHEPFSKPVSALYADAYEELLRPMPSTRILDFPNLAEVTGGFRPFEFSILCGATGVGKTTLLANWSASLLRQREPHFVASVETGATDFVKRTLSVMDNRDHNHGDPISLRDAKRLHIEHGSHFQTENLWLSLYSNRFKVETLMADIAHHVYDRGCKIAMIDNLNFFMEVTRASDQIVEMDRVIHELIIFCKQVPVHVVMVMHPRKTDGGRVESEFDIKGSSTAVQEAHNVFLFNRPDPAMVEQKLCQVGDRELKIAKMRRRGKAVGRRIILQAHDSVRYGEIGAYDAAGNVESDRGDRSRDQGRVPGGSDQVGGREPRLGLDQGNRPFRGGDYRGLPDEEL